MARKTRRGPAPGLSHLDRRGNVRMVDVSAKQPTVRQAVASTRVTGRPEVIAAILDNRLEKGEALAAARIAAVMAAKRTAEWIPMCHPLPLDWIDVAFDSPDEGAIRILATVKTSARTGVEMEALTAVSAAALTIYDMAKSADKSLVIGPTQLESKSGGKSGDYRR